MDPEERDVAARIALGGLAMALAFVGTLLILGTEDWDKPARLGVISVPGAAGWWLVWRAEGRSRGSDQSNRGWRRRVGTHPFRSVPHSVWSRLEHGDGVWATRSSGSAAVSRWPAGLGVFFFAGLAVVAAVVAGGEDRAGELTVLGFAGFLVFGGAVGAALLSTVRFLGSGRAVRFDESGITLGLALGYFPPRKFKPPELLKVSVTDGSIQILARGRRVHRHRLSRQQLDGLAPALGDTLGDGDVAPSTGDKSPASPPSPPVAAGSDPGSSTSRDGDVGEAGVVDASLSRLLSRVRVQAAMTVEPPDLESYLGLVTPLLAEWAALDFDEQGRVINPLTGSAQQSLVLIGGRHRQLGARYRSTTVNREPTPDPVHQSSAQKPGNATGPTGSNSTTVHVTLRDDSPRTLAFQVDDDANLWTADVDVEPFATPKITVKAQANLSEAWKQDNDVPALFAGCLSSLLGGTAKLDLHIDTRALANRRDTFLNAKGQVSRFPGRARIDIDSSTDPWDGSIDIVVKARGVGRLAFLVGGGWVRRKLSDGVEHGLAAINHPQRGLRPVSQHLADDIDAAGGPQQYVHHSLWDPDFDAHTH